MTEGFFVVHRADMDEKWWMDARPFVRCLWLHLMVRANFAERKTRLGEVLRPGMLVTSWRGLSQALAWRENRHRIAPTVSTVRRAMDHLHRVGEVSWTVVEITPTGTPTGTAAGVKVGTATGGGIVVTLERWAFHQRATGTATGGRRGTPTGTPTGTAAPQEQRGRSEQRRSELVPGIDCNNTRREWELSSMSSEQREDLLRGLQEEIPILEEDLVGVRGNGNDLGKVRKLEQKIQQSREALIQIEGLVNPKGTSS